MPFNLVLHRKWNSTGFQLAENQAPLLLQMFYHHKHKQHLENEIQAAQMNEPDINENELINQLRDWVSVYKSMV